MWDHTFKHYIRLFRAAVHDNGWAYALLRTKGFLQHHLGSRVGQLLRRSPADSLPLTSPFSTILETLPTPATSRPLLLILSDTKIRQCVHYRIDQKIRFLNRIGLNAMHISPDDLSRLNSFLPLAHTIIIYRTALSQERISQCRRYNARVIFEVDDLIVGRSPLAGC